MALYIGALDEKYPGSILGRTNSRNELFLGWFWCGFGDSERVINENNTCELGLKVFPKNSSGSPGCSPQQCPGASCPGLRTIMSPSTNSAHGRLTTFPIMNINIMITVSACITQGHRVKSKIGYRYSGDCKNGIKGRK